MKKFSQIAFELATCRQQLSEFHKLLQDYQFLLERDKILPFFRERWYLSAFMGYYHRKISRYDLVAFEYDLFGDFVCDLVVGDSVKKSYCFIEFEAAAVNSIFVSKPGRNTPEWSSKFERGFSQIVD